MKKKENIVCYTSEELRQKIANGESQTDWEKVGAMTDEELEAIIDADHDDEGAFEDWTKAKLVIPSRKQSVNLRLENDIVDFFKKQGKGHISKMQAVLRSYVNAHKTSQA